MKTPRLILSVALFFISIFTDSGWAQTVLQENFSAATGMIKHSTSTNTLSLSPQIGSVSIYSGDDASLAAGLNGASQSIVATDNVAGNGFYLTYTPSTTLTSSMGAGTANFSFDFKASSSGFNNSASLEVDLSNGSNVITRALFYFGSPFGTGPYGAVQNGTGLNFGFTMTDGDVYHFSEILNTSAQTYTATLTDLTHPGTQTLTTQAFYPGHFGTGINSVVVSFGQWDFASTTGNGASITFDNLILGAGAASLGMAYDEFYLNTGGVPFSSWINVKTQGAGHNAVGDGSTDDTAAINYALSNVGTPGYGSVVYLPAGTYKISDQSTINGVRVGLSLLQKANVALMGQDPMTTIIKWAGASGGTMLNIDAVENSRYGRITWDGSGTAGAAVQNLWNKPMYPSPSNANFYHTDEVFQNVGKGIEAGGDVAPYGSGDGPGTVVRCRFYNCSGAGISSEGPNAFPWWVWDSEFVNNATGISNGAINDTFQYGGGLYYVYRSYFQNSSVADIASVGGRWMAIRGNTSVGSYQFYRDISNGQFGGPLTIQNNKILDVQDTARPAIDVGDTGNLMMLNNQIRNLAGSTEQPVGMVGSGIEPAICSIVNTYTVSPNIWVNQLYNSLGNADSWMVGDNVVSTGSISNAYNPLPGTAPYLARPTLEPSAGNTSTQIQNAIYTAVASYSGKHPVVHVPAGNYAINSTTPTITIPAGADVQLVGDYGAATNFNKSSSDNGPVLQLTGPSKATISDITFNGDNTNATNASIFISNTDQVGAKIYAENYVWEECTQYGLWVDGCQNVTVEAHAGSLETGSAPSSSRVVEVDGAGGGGAGVVTLFGADLDVPNPTATTFGITQGARFVGTDGDVEGGAPQLINLTGTGTVTFDDYRFQQNSNVPNEPDTADMPAIEINGFNGLATFTNIVLSSIDENNRNILVTNEVAGTQALFIGADGGTTNATNYFTRTGSGGTAAFMNGEYYSPVTLDDFYQVPDQGTARTSLNIPTMLNQLSTVLPTYPAALASGVTDVRLYNTYTGGIPLVGVLVSPGTAAPPVVSITSPGGSAAPLGNYYIAPATVTINATASEIGGTISNVHFYENGTSLGSTSTSPYTCMWSTAPKGKYTLTATATDSTSASSSVTTPITIFATGNINSTSGGASYNSSTGVFTATGEGAGIVGTADGFRYVYEPVTGDVTVTARVLSASGTASNARAGVMIRQSLSSNDMEASTLFNPVTNQVVLTDRTSLGETTFFTAATATAPPNCWVQMVRSGNSFSAYQSSDGITWVQVGSTQTIYMSNTIYVGLAVTSGTTSSTTMATFDNMKVP